MGQAIGPRDTRRPIATLKSARHCANPWRSGNASAARRCRLAINLIACPEAMTRAPLRRGFSYHSPLHGSGRGGLLAAFPIHRRFGRNRLQPFRVAPTKRDLNPFLLGAAVQPPVPGNGEPSASRAPLAVEAGARQRLSVGAVLGFRGTDEWTVYSLPGGVYPRLQIWGRLYVHLAGWPRRAAVARTLADRHISGIRCRNHHTTARLPSRVELALVSPSAEPPAGDGWMHEVKHDGHRLVAILDGRGGLRLTSRNGFDRTAAFRAPFDAALGRVRCEMVLDGEIAVPDARGVTHIADLQDAIVRRRPERLAFFAFDLLHLAGRDLRREAIEDRKTLLRDAIGDMDAARVAYVDHIIGRGAELFERVQAIGAEGIVSKRVGSPYRPGRSADWLKTKCSAVGEFVIVGLVELAGGRLEAVVVAEKIGSGEPAPMGQVRFGLAGKGLWALLDTIRTGPARRGGFVPVETLLVATVKFFGRFKASNAIRDGVLIGMPRLRGAAAVSPP